MLSKDNIFFPETETQEPTNPCPIPDKIPPFKHDHLRPPKPSFTQLEEFIQVKHKVFETLERVYKLETYMKKSFENFISTITTDNTTFKELLVTTYNQFAETVHTEVNSFETELNASFELFKTAVNENWDSFLGRYETFKTEITNQQNDFETLITEGYETFKTEITNQQNDFETLATEKQNTFENNITKAFTDFKSEITKLFNNECKAIEERLTKHDETHTKAFNDYTTTTNKVINDFKTSTTNNFNKFVNDVNADIEAFKVDWTKTVNNRLNGQDAILNDAILYMKTNLSANVTSAVQDLIINGDLQINDLPNIINVQAQGVEPYTDEDSSILLNDIISRATKGTIIYIPNGEYLIGDTINVPSFISIIGESKSGVILRCGRSDNGDLFNLIQSNQRDYAEHIHIENLTITSCYDDVNYFGIGINSGVAVAYSTFKNLSVKTFEAGLYLFKGGWLNSFEDIDICANRIGFYYGNTGTTTYLKNVFCYSCGSGFEFHNLVYSNFDNVACDSSNDTAYKFEGCSININGLGCESVNIKHIINANNSTININNMFAFSNTNFLATFRVFVLNNSTVNVNGLKLDNSETIVEGGLYSLSTYSHLNINDYISETTFITKPISYDDSNTIHINGIDNHPIEIKIFSMKPFIGTANAKKQKLNSLLNEEMHTGAIWFNNDGTPLMGANEANHKWSKVRSQGDLFINNMPRKNGVAMWQQAYKDIYKITISDDLKIDDVINTDKANCYWASSIMLPECVHNAYGAVDVSIKTGLKLVNKERTFETPLITYYNYGSADGYSIQFESAIDIKQIISLVNEDNLYLCIASRLEECKFVEIPIIYVHYFTQLNINKGNFPDGLMVFDKSKKRPLWAYEGKLYDVNGVEQTNDNN